MNKDLPDGWKWVQLGDICFEVSDRIDNPSKSGLERFVGLEHLDSESLTVKRWGSIDDVTSAMKLFKKGDMLFARRNAYLKRASMATFDGVCSGDAIVLRQKNEEYVNGLLPFILNAEKLWDFAIANASGSMSKRVKWRNLATFEIPLPPKEERYRITDMLWAAEECIAKNEQLVDKTEIYKKILMMELFTKGIGHRKFKNTEIGKVPEEWDVVPFKKIYYIPSRVGIYKGKDFLGTGYKLVRMTEFFKGDVLCLDCSERIQLSNDELERYSLKGGDLLFGRRSLNIEGAGKCVLVPEIKDSIVFESSIIRARINQDMASPMFFFNYFNGIGRRQIIKIIRSVAASGITGTDLENILIPLPPLPEQYQIAEILSKLDNTIQNGKKYINNTNTLKMRLINHFLMNGVEIAPSDNSQSKPIIYETQVSE